MTQQFVVGASKHTPLQSGVMVSNHQFMPQRAKRSHRPHPTTRLTTQAGSLRWDPLLSGDEAARRLGIKRDTLNKWRTIKHECAPRAFKLDQTVRYRTSDVQEVLNRLSGRNHALLVILNDDDPLMNLTDASAYLSIPGPSISTWRSTRPDYGPPAIKIGGAVRYRLSDLNDWIEQHLEPTGRLQDAAT